MESAFGVDHGEIAKARFPSTGNHRSAFGSMKDLHGVLTNGGVKGGPTFKREMNLTKKRVGQLRTIDDTRLDAMTTFKGQVSRRGKTSTSLITPRWRKEWS